MAFGKKFTPIREDIVELGEGTDTQTCDKLGGTIGSDKKCRLVTSGVGEDGDIHVKITKRSGLQPQTKE